MKVISTCHKAGWDQYGQGWLDGIDNWPKAEFILYTEGFDLDDPRVEARKIEDVERAVAFKKQYAHYKPLAWRWDIVRFSNKVFAAYDALYNHRGLAVRGEEQTSDLQSDVCSSDLTARPRWL